MATTYGQSGWAVILTDEGRTERRVPQYTPVGLHSTHEIAVELGVRLIAWSGDYARHAGLTDSEADRVVGLITDGASGAYWAIPGM